MPTDVREVINQSESNRTELIAVIEHYKGVDEEKLEAAYYLISNLPYQFSYEGHDKFESAFEQTESYILANGFNVEGVEKFNDLFNSIRYKEGNSFFVQDDLRNITAEYLIENIDLAFEAYYKIPEHLRSSKELFMKYVLPYRINNEPLETGLRRYYFEKFSWAYDHLEEHSSLEKTVCTVLKSMDLKSADFNYNSPPISKVYELGFGNCHTLTSLSVFVLRALGIPAVNDITPGWGNTTRLGSPAPGGANHEWAVFFTKDDFYAIDPNLAILNRMYEKVGSPKYYRKTFEANPEKSLYPAYVDVTEEYRNTSDIQIELASQVDNAYLTIFSLTRGWVPAAESRHTEEGFLFSSVGRDVVYGISDPDDATQLHAPPIYVNTSGNMHHLEPDHEEKITAKLTRKWPPYIVRNLPKIQWNTSLNGIEIQAANQNDFSDAATLYVIENYDSPHKQKIDIENDREYKYYRLISHDPEVKHLAGFHLLDVNKDIINADWQVITGEEQNVHENGGNLVDDDPLTFVADSHMNVMYEFPEPVQISHFQIQARNDDNNIKPGDWYELMYWDDKWQSAGRKLAEDTLLIYEDLPSNALYWLKNHSRGQEENIFMLTENGDQFWPGLNKLDAELQDPQTFWRDKLCDL